MDCLSVNVAGEIFHHWELAETLVWQPLDYYWGTCFIRVDDSLQIASHSWPSFSNTCECCR